MDWSCRQRPMTTRVTRSRPTRETSSPWATRALSELVDKKVALETHITDGAVLKAKLDKMSAADKAKGEAEQEATEKARSSAPNDAGKVSWAVKCCQIDAEGFPHQGSSPQPSTNH